MAGPEGSRSQPVPGMKRREIILKRAGELFERNGFADTSLQDIADAAGIAREGIYYYFKNKTQILLELILPVSQSLMTGLTDLLAADIDCVDKLRSAMRNHLGAFNPDYIEMTLALRNVYTEQEDEKLAELTTLWKEYEKSWIELIAQGQKSGAFVADLDPKIVAFGILGMCNWMSRWYDPARSATIDEISDIFFRLVADKFALTGPSK
jgi:AcrR family transcriptional regulator